MRDWSRWSREKRDDFIQLKYEKLKAADVRQWGRMDSDYVPTDEDFQNCAEDLEYWIGED